MNTKAKSKKYFRPFVKVIKYNYENEELELISNYNTYCDSGIMFDEKNRNDIQNISEFFDSYFALKDAYLFDSMNVFGTSIDSKQEHILYHEYGINYIPLKIFSYEELQKFVKYIPCLQEIDIEKIQSCDLTMTNFVINPDGNPKKLEFSIPKSNIDKLGIFDDCEKNEEFHKIVSDPSCDEACKIGLYFTGQEQNKVSLMFNILDKNILGKKLDDDITSVLYEITWEDKKISKTTVSHLETTETQNLGA